jgi:hypothetical protein
LLPVGIYRETAEYKWSETEMGQPERDFLNYYRENMQKTPGITLLGEVPKTLWGNIGKAAASLSGMCAYIVAAGEGATVTAMIASIPASSGAYGAASTVVKIAGIVGASAAAYYLGACIGSTMVASYKVRAPYSRAYGARLGAVKYPPPVLNGRFPNAPRNYITITEASDFLRFNCSKTRMPFEVQMMFHKFPQLLKCH